MRRVLLAVFAALLAIPWIALTSHASTAAPQNWAVAGAQIVGGDITLRPSTHCDAAAFLDEDETTGFSAPAGTTVAVALVTAVDVTSFAIDPGPVCGDTADAALGQYVLETSTDGQTWTAVPVPAFTAVDDNVLNDITPAATIAGVRYVRVQLVASQGTAAYVDLADLRVYGTASPLVGTTTATTPAATTTTTGTTPARTAKKAPAPKKATTVAAPAALTIPVPHAATALHFTGGLKLGLTCAVACSSQVTLTLSPLGKRQLHTSPAQAFAHTFKVGAGTWLVTVRASPRVLQAARKHHRRTVTFVLRAVTDAGTSGTRTLTSTLHLRLY